MYQRKLNITVYKGKILRLVDELNQFQIQERGTQASETDKKVIPPMNKTFAFGKTKYFIRRCITCPGIGKYYTIRIQYVAHQGQLEQKTK